MEQSDIREPYSCYFSDGDIPEDRARKRRFEQFEPTSGLKEELDYTSLKHQQLCKLVKTKTKARLNHTSFWYLGNMAVVMTEPYNIKLEDFKCIELYVVEIPDNISPYCGRFDATPGAEPWTKSFLITSILKKRQLDEVIKRLTEREKELPPWNQE